MTTGGLTPAQVVEIYRFSAPAVGADICERRRAVLAVGIGDVDARNDVGCLTVTGERLQVRSRRDIEVHCVQLGWPGFQHHRRANDRFRN